MKKLNLILIYIGLLGLVTMSIIAMIDSHAEDMASGIIVQLLFSSLFIASYISYNSDE